MSPTDTGVSTSAARTRRARTLRAGRSLPHACSAPRLGMFWCLVLVGFCRGHLVKPCGSPPPRRATGFPSKRDRRPRAAAALRTWSWGLCGWRLVRRALARTHSPGQPPTRGNDPSAGSPTETLLRLHLPLNDKVYLTFHGNAATRTDPATIREVHRTIQSVGATGGVYKGQGRNQCKLMTCAY